MDTATSARIFAEIKANSAKLNTCKGPHDFLPIDPNEKLVRRYRCELCGGELNAIEVLWYRRGVEHGKAR